MTGWHCLDCDAQASTDVTTAEAKGLVAVSREMHELSGHETTAGARDSALTNQ